MYFKVIDTPSVALTFLYDAPIYGKLSFRVSIYSPSILLQGVLLGLHVRS